MKTASIIAVLAVSASALFLAGCSSHKHYWSPATTQYEPVELPANIAQLPQDKADEVHLIAMEHGLQDQRTQDAIKEAGGLPESAVILGHITATAGADGTWTSVGAYLAESAAEHGGNTVIVYRKELSNHIVPAQSFTYGSANVYSTGYGSAVAYGHSSTSTVPAHSVAVPVMYGFVVIK